METKPALRFSLSNCSGGILETFYMLNAKMYVLFKRWNCSVSWNITGKQIVAWANRGMNWINTAQKMKFSTKDFFCKGCFPFS